MMQNLRASQRDADKTGDSSLPSKTLKFLVVLIIFFASTQLGYHFWPLSSLVYGIRIDYLSPTLYFLDLLILVYLGLATSWDWRSVLKRKTWLQVKLGSAGTSSAIALEKWLQKRGVLGGQYERTDLSGIGALLPLLLTNLLFSQNPLSTLNWSLHFLLYFAFMRRLLDRRPEQSSSRDTEGGRRLLVDTFIFALLFQLALGFAQFSLGHSVGGLMYYLGERMVAVGSPGIATTMLMGQTMLRAYGTFSHPNILAGWSVIVLLILIQIGKTAIPKVSKQRAVRGSDPLRRSWPAAKMFSRLQNTIWRPGQTLPVLATILIIFLTGSRSAALALFGFVIPFHLIQKTKSRIVYFLICLIVCGYVLFNYPIPRSDLSISQRLDLQGVSLKVISHFPIFGTGAQSSISTYPAVSPSTRLLQPDHNSFTLFLSWFGLFGFLAMIPLLSRINGFTVIRTLIPLLPLLLLDHYLLTSPQGLFILLLYLFVAVNYTHAQKDRK